MVSLHKVGHLVLRALGHQDWIRYGVREKLLRIFCNPDRVPSYEFEIEFFGLTYVGNLNCFLDWCVYFYGAFEKQELFLLRDLANKAPGTIFLDVGANVGQHSLFMSRYCKEVHAFEPYETVRRELDRKIKLNRCKNVAVHGVGLGAMEEELNYFAPRGANTGTGSFLITHASDNNVNIGKLRIVNGDAYLAQIGRQDIGLIKIDVEGSRKMFWRG